MRQLAGWDLAAWRMAKTDPALRSTVVGVVELHGAVSTELILERIHRVVARESVLRSIIVEDASGAYITEVAEIDVKNHVSIPPTVMDVARSLSDFAERDFDPRYPLWRTLILHTGQKTYIATAFHHAIADGQAAMLMLSQLVDEPPLLPEIATQQAKRQNTKTFQESAKPVVERLLRDPLGLSGDITRLVQSINAVLQVPPLGSESKRSGAFHFAAWEFGRDDTALSVHDALVAVTVAGWNAKTGKESVVANIPVAGFDVGGLNRFMIARLRLRAHPDRPTDVIAESRQALKDWRAEPASELLPLLLKASQFIPANILGNAMKHGDITVSTVRGDATQSSIGGVPVSKVIPMVSPIGVAINVTSAILGNRVIVGVTADTAVFDSRSELISLFEDSFRRIFGFSPTLIRF